MVRAWVAILGLLAFAALFAALGAWQVQRAETSRATQALFASGAADETLASLPRELGDAVRFRRVAIEGEYVEKPQFLLDNMLHEGAAGFDVLTALRVRGSEQRVLVNRGWVPAGDRTVLPDVAVAGESRTVSGRLDRLPRPGLRLGGETPDRGDALVVVEFPTADELARRLGAPVLDYQVLLEPTAEDGYVRDWQAPGLSPERHIAYAGQWFALGLGALAAAIVMAVRTVRRRP
ncbi:MAG TPA: SURF1 family protein [Gammaproteobacteria bacterium]